MLRGRDHGRDDKSIINGMINVIHDLIDTGILYLEADISMTDDTL